MIPVHLNEGEQKLVELLVQIRRKNNADAQVTGSPYFGKDEEDGFEVDVDAYGAEFAFAKAFNMYPDMSVDPRSGGADFVIDGKDNRVTIDVKHTTLKNGRLLVKKSKNVGDVGVYALVTGKMPYYNIVGRCSATFLMREEHIIDLGHGETYGLDQDKLTPFDENTYYYNPSTLRDER
jgi:hypothetical protein